jgi:hypothetical protein
MGPEKNGREGRQRLFYGVTKVADALQLLNQQFDSSYDAWSRIAQTLKVDIAGLQDAEFVTNRPVSKLILTWMHRLGEFQTKFGKLFGRKKRPPIADDFTAAVAVCLEQFLAAKGMAGKVHCEETTHPQRGAMRPDISVCSLAGLLVAAVECKTNLGWKRNEWQDHIAKRTQQLRAACPGSAFYLCVLTRSNWDYSEFESCSECGKTWFCLSAVPVGRISDPVADSDVLLPIEPMFLDILARLRDGFAENIRQLPLNHQERILRTLQETSRTLGGPGDTSPPTTW